MDVAKTVETAANMLPPHSKQSSNLAEAEVEEQQAADTALDHRGEYAVSHGDGISQSTPVRAPAAPQTATGDKRKRGDDAGEPGDGIKRQLIALPFRGRVAAPPSYQEQQVLTHSKVQSPTTEPGLPQVSNSSPDKSPSTSGVVLDATEGYKFLGALFSVVSMNRMLSHKWELYEDCRGQYRRRCDVVNSFQSSLKDAETKKKFTTVDPKLLNEIVAYRDQVNKLKPGRDALEEEASKLLRDCDALQDEVDASVEDLFVFDASLKDDELLRFLRFGADFWKMFEARRSAAKEVAENTRARLGAIEDERSAIRGRMEGRCKQTLHGYLVRAQTQSRGASRRGGAPRMTVPGPQTEQELQRLSELLLQERKFRDEENYKAVKDLRSQSEAILKLAESALVDAGLFRARGQ